MVNKFLKIIPPALFIINLLTVLWLILQIILPIIFPVVIYEFMNDPSHKLYLDIVKNALIWPTFIFWFYNMIFLFRHDRYGRSVFPLVIFNFLYSPVYYYQVQIKKRPLVNKMKSEAVIGRTIQLENYENDPVPHSSSPEAKNGKN